MVLVVLRILKTCVLDLCVMSVARSEIALPGMKTKSEVITGDRGRRGLLSPWA